MRAFPPPPQHGAEDVSQFDSRFTKMPVVDSPVEASLSESANLAFQVSLLGNPSWVHACQAYSANACREVSQHAHTAQIACSVAVWGKLITMCT